MPITLYVTDALPMHYVAVDEDGSQWLIPCSPMGSEVWLHAKPYRGNYELRRVAPQIIEQFYQRPEPDPDEEPRRMGRPPGNRPPTGRAQWTIRQDVLDAVKAEAARTGQHEYMIVELAVMMMLPEHFDHD